MGVFRKIEKFYYSFNGEKGVLGYSVLGRPIYFMSVKKTDRPKMIFTYAIHAREYVTAYLALKQIKRFVRRAKYGTAYFIPLVNPDGVEIAERIDGLYKANGRGVDLNVNFDARWGAGEKNVRVSGAENFIGEKPFSEPETTALRDFTISVDPDITFSYHAKGEEIYWEFFQSEEKKATDKAIAKKVAKITGYKIKSTPNSAGGYKDWCIEKLKIPALTIEVGSDKLTHPIKKRHVKKIYRKNKRVAEETSEYLWRKNAVKVYEAGD